MSSIKKRKLFHSLGLMNLISQEDIWGVSDAMVSFKKLCEINENQREVCDSLSVKTKKKILVQECGKFLEYICDIRKRSH